MFTLTDTPVKFIALLVLFIWCTLWCGYELTRPQSGTQRISNILHLVMAIVMLAMVPGSLWKPLEAIIPTWAFTVGFGLSTIWFCWLLLRAWQSKDQAGKRHFGAHTLMFAAMTWHLAAMAAMSSAMTMPTQGQTGGHGDGMGHDMGHGDAMQSMATTMDAMREPGGTLWWFAVIGLPLMAYLLAVSCYYLVQALKPTAPNPPAASAACCHEVRPAGSAKFRLTALSDFAMNFGMFWMSTGLLTPILPFIAALSF